MTLTMLTVSHPISARVGLQVKKAWLFSLAQMGMLPLLLLMNVFSISLFFL